MSSKGTTPAPRIYPPLINVCSGRFLININPAMLSKERVPLDVSDIVLSHLHDVETLRSCALVCSSWLPLARPYLFRGVVYRPAVPAQTFKDLLAFLSTLPHHNTFLRSVTVDGLTRDGERRLDLSAEEIVEALAQLPAVTHITLTTLRLTQSIPSAAPDPSPRSGRAAKTVRIEDCTIARNAVPFRQFLSLFGHINVLVLDRVSFESASNGQLGQLPPLQVQLESICIDAVTGSSYALRRVFPGGNDTQSTPLSISIAPQGLIAAITANDILSPFTHQVHTLSMNVLGISCGLRWIVEGQGQSPPLTPSQLLKQWPRLNVSHRYPSLHTLVLYSTTTSLARRESATLLYAGILANNWRLLSSAPPTLRRVELRFQRYGPHWRDTIDELWAIDDFEPSVVRWEDVDAGTLVRFPDLESFTCVLCDDGFVEQWGPIKGSPEITRSVHSRQVEYDDYAAFLRDALPRLHAAGRLLFRMSEV